MTYDVVIRGGTVVDGSGLTPYRSDVGIRDGRIAAIGRIRERGAQEVDADGLVVTPGFIDGHTHMDAQVFWDRLGSPSCYHGITTVVMGHCGFTLAPADPQKRALVVRNLERAEDISGAAMAAGIDWTWTTFAEYLDAVDRQPKGLNYVANIGHSALRTFAMGERAFSEEASPEDLAVMDAELRAALLAGANGFTTSRSPGHETSDDRPVASRLAAWDEVVALVGAMGELGAGVFQLVEDRTDDDAERVREDRLIALALATGVTIAVPATQAQRTLDFIDRATAAGAHIFGLTHSRGIGNMSSFRSRMPFDGLPEWRELRAMSLDEKRRALRDPEVRKRLVHSAHHSEFGRAIGAEARPPDYDQMTVMQRPIPPNPTVSELAASRGVDPVELILDLAVESDLEQFFWQPLRPVNLDAVKAAMKHPGTVMTFSDAGAHVSQVSDVSIQTHLLSHWVRGTGDFTLEEAVQMLTLQPARQWGLHDRGLLREGLVADINVFDAERIAPAMPVIVHDLPADQPRILQKADGIAATLVAGQIVHRDGEHTGALPGQLIRGPLARRP